MMQPRLKHFGWGREGEGLTSAEEAFVFGRIEQQFGSLADGEVKPPRLEDLKLESPRLNPPASLPFCSTAHYDRAAHTYGKSFPVYVRGLVGDYSNAPDVVAYPRTEEEIVAVLDWAGGAQASVTLPMTAAGYSVLERELKRRIQLDRPRLIERLQEAIADELRTWPRILNIRLLNQNKRSMRRALPSKDKLARAEVINVSSGAAIGCGLVCARVGVDQRSAARNRVVRRQHSPGRSLGYGFWPRLAVATLLIALLAGLLAADLREKQDSGGFLKLAVVLAAAGLAGTLAWGGHGIGGAGMGGRIHLAADFVHLIAAAAWVGGLLPLALMLAAAGASVTVAHAVSLRFSVSWDHRCRRAVAHRRDQYLVPGGQHPGIDRDRLRPSPTGQDHLVPRHAGARDGQSALAYACAHCERGRKAGAPCAPATAPQRRYRDWRWRCHSLPRGRAWRDTARPGRIAPPLAFASLISRESSRSR